MPEVRIDLQEVAPATDPALARALLALQRAAYAVEAELIGDDRIPALHEDVAGLRAAPLQWLAASTRDVLVGAVAWAERGGEVDVDRLVVAPGAHRRGVGSALVRAVLARAGGRRTTVATGRDNVPAGALYQRLGFTRVDDVEVLPGLWVTRYAHPPGGAAARPGSGWGQAAGSTAPAG